MIATSAFLKQPSSLSFNHMAKINDFNDRLNGDYSKLVELLMGQGQEPVSYASYRKTVMMRREKQDPK